MDHFIPGAKRSGVSGSDHQLIDFILAFIRLFVVYLMTLSVAQTM
jgi:hypothetical protein